MKTSENGNVFVYVLIAVILFAGVTFVLSKAGQQRDPDATLSDGKVKVDANGIMAFAASVMNSITQMNVVGITDDQIDFTLPSDASFNTAPTRTKLFHPDGGGLNYKPLPSTAIASDGSGLAPGYYVGRFNNVDWTPSATNDVMFAAHEITQAVCAEINRKVTGDATIPAISGANLEDLFVNASLHGGSNTNLTKALCASCENRPALCVSNAGATKFTFYSILIAN